MIRSSSTSVTMLVRLYAVFVNGCVCPGWFWGNCGRMPKKAGEDTRGAKAKEQKARSAAEKKERDDAAKRAAEEAEWAQGANARALKKCGEHHSKVHTDAVGQSLFVRCYVTGSMKKK